MTWVVSDGRCRQSWHQLDSRRVGFRSSRRTLSFGPSVTYGGRRSGVPRLIACEREPRNLNRRIYDERGVAKIRKRATTNTHIKSMSLTQRGAAINFHSGNSSRRLRSFPASKRQVRRWLARLLRRPTTTQHSARLVFRLSLKQCRRRRPTRPEL